MNIAINNASIRPNIARAVRRKTYFTNPKLVSKYLCEKGDIASYFGNNRVMALLSKYCYKIFQEFMSMYNVELNMPPNMIVYNEDDTYINDHPDFFCLKDTSNVIQNIKPVLGRSILLQDVRTLDDLYRKTWQNYENKETSSPHFLSPLIHEWTHSLCLDIVYSKLGYDGNCIQMKCNYPNKNETMSSKQFLENLGKQKLSEKDAEIVKSILGKAAVECHGQYPEIVCEGTAKFICESLSEDCKHLEKNPIDAFKKTPEEFQEIFKKVWEIVTLREAL